MFLCKQPHLCLGVVVGYHASLTNLRSLISTWGQIDNISTMFFTLLFQGAIDKANRVPGMQIAAQFNFCPHVELTPNFPTLIVTPPKY